LPGELGSIHLQLDADLNLLDGDAVGGRTIPFVVTPAGDQSRAVHVAQDVVVFQLDTPDFLDLIYGKFPGVVNIFSAR
jgi:hypothetical protein